MAKRITTQELHNEVQQIKNNHLAHMAEDIDDLKESVKENRTFFTERMDRLDNRIFWILGLVISTLATVIGSILV
jgi:hypothetical protein